MEPLFQVVEVLGESWSLVDLAYKLFVLLEEGDYLREQVLGIPDRGLYLPVDHSQLYQVQFLEHIGVRILRWRGCR